MTKILVIEDEDQVREIILEMLEAEEFNAIGAENGSVGVQLALEQIPDLILCDVMMPELDGYGVITALRQNPATETIPFIFLTAKASKPDIRQGMDLGADDYLTKPFTLNELLAAISTRLEKKKTIDKQAQEKLDDLRSSIVLSLPHELRTPLNGIIGFSSLLIDSYDSMDKEEVVEILSDINFSAKRLHRLLQNYLLYAELELVATKPERVKELRNCQISYPQKAIAEVACQKAQEAGREADLYVELQEATVQISEPKLRKLVEEIIDNAFKFSPKGTSVRVLTFSEDNTFNLCISDRGRGMSAEQIAKVGAYMQFERKLYEQQGSGLGLIVAKRLAELHGGRLAIESTLGEQTTVRVALPVGLQTKG